MIFEQSIEINATSTVVERCFTELELMHRWLNPTLRCEPIGEWNTDLGGRSLFIVKIPIWKPTLESIVVERKPGLVVWQFTGFFEGRDRWECRENSTGTILINRFKFEIPNPLVSWGFQTFAATWTQKDMQEQLRRLKKVAEEIQS
jgi:hypothetical protein